MQASKKCRAVVVSVAASTTARGAPVSTATASEQPRVDLGAVEVGPHHPRGELGQLAGHPDEDDLAHFALRRPAQGDPGEVTHLDQAHRIEPE
jgi:hypothetical protein